MTVVLIPCKHLNRGKSRLAAHLSPRSRRALCEFFLCHTLDVATQVVAASRVYVVTSDPRAAAIATEYGATAIADGDANLNCALALGRARVRADAGNCAGLILPIDLPLATPAALARLNGVAPAIVPDESGEGTNVLRLGPAMFHTFRFAFGADSFATHRAQARRMGIDLQVVNDPLLTFDVDTVAQYQRFVAVTGRSL